MADEILARWGNWDEGHNLRNGGVESRDYVDDDKDPESEGQDDQVFDDVGNADLTVWSGHGTSSIFEPNERWTLLVGTPWSGGGYDYDECNAVAPLEMVFGEQGGDPYSSTGGDAEFVMMDASCSALHTDDDHGEVDEVWHAGNDNGMMARVHQGFGFTDSPCDKPNRLKQWIKKIDNGQTNVSAWLDAGYGCGLFGSDSYPLAITKDDDDAGSRANTERLESPLSDPAYYGAEWQHNWIEADGDECGL